MIEPPEHPALERLRRDVTLSAGARQGAAWIAASRLSAQGFQFLVSIVTARLLLPSQFGEAAIALSIAGFAQLFSSLGLSASVVHAKEVTEELLCTAFWFTIISGIAFAVLLSGLSVPLAAAFDKPHLEPLLILASLNFVIASSAVQTALLERTFHFKRLAILETSSNVLGVAAIPIAALSGMGAASLIFGPLLGSFVLNTSLWISVRWRPHQGPNARAAKELWLYARGLVGFNAVNYWSRNLDNVLLGAATTASALGQYTRAYSLTGMPVNQMSNVLGRVLFPALSRMRDDPPRVARAWGRGVAMAGSVTMPIVVGLATMAPALVSVLYGARWVPMVPVLQLLALACVPQIVSASTGMVYRATGHTGLLFRRGLLLSGMSIVAIVAGLPWGTVGVATALLIKSWLGVYIIVAPLAKILQTPLRELLRPAVGIGWPVIGLAAGTIFVRAISPDGAQPWQTLVTQIGVGGAFYFLAMWRTDAPAFRMGRDRLRSLVMRVAPGVR